MTADVGSVCHQAHRSRAVDAQVTYAGKDLAERCEAVAVLQHLLQWRAVTTRPCGRLEDEEVSAAKTALSMTWVDARLKVPRSVSTRPTQNRAYASRWHLCVMSSMTCWIPPPALAAPVRVIATPFRFIDDKSTVAPCFTYRQYDE